MNETTWPPPDSPPPIAPNRIVFSGPRSIFVKLVMRGALLELVTLGFYRFWLATDMRRHLWSNTSVGGDAAEYTGTAKELLIGFLFALAILAPIYLIYFLIGLEAERLRAFASVPLVLFFYLFAQFAIYRARRYRLTRTVWRGVRFWMTGSGVSYAWRAGLWMLLTFVTLGLALPWARAALERYKMRHTAYGDLQGSFVATGGQLFRRGWWLWLLAWLPLVLMALAALPNVPDPWGRAFIVLLSLLFLFFYPFIFARFKAIEWRWWVSGIRIGEVHFESDLAPGALIGLYWKVIGWSILFLLIFATWVGIVAGIAYASADFSGLSTDSEAEIAQRMELMLRQIPALAAIGVGYALTALMSGAVIRIYLMRDVWQRVADSVTVQNLAAAENVAARGETVSALGEGFANSLDVTGF
jgi:uncharacterized membrane protein YjgN (DUF898 family)